MQRTRNGGATPPAVGARIIHFEFALATEAADNIDFPAHLGHRHLGAGGGHWGADDPATDALGEGRDNEQGTAGYQHAAEKCDEFAAPHHSIPRRPPFAERNVMECLPDLRPRLHPSGLMLAAWITLPHFSISSAISFPKSAGEPGSGVLPKLASREFIFGSAKAALTSLLS